MSENNQVLRAVLIERSRDVLMLRAFYKDPTMEQRLAEKLRKRYEDERDQQGLPTSVSSWARFLQAECLRLMALNEWVKVEEGLPVCVERYADFKDKPYVLAVDTRGRMSIGYAVKYADGSIRWTFAKPIGPVTHWQPLPDAPLPEGEKE